MAWFNISRKRSPNTYSLTEQILENMGSGALFGSVSTSLKHIPDMTLSGVFAAVEKISNAVAQLPIYVKTRKDNRKEIVDQHPIYDALHNSLLTKYNLIKNLVTDMLLYGDGFAYIKRNSKGDPIEIIYCPHGTVDIQYNDSNLFKHELYYSVPSLRTGRIEPINMIHVLKNTKDGVHGIGIIKYAKDVLRLAGYTEQAADNYFSSGLNVSGILKTTDPRIKIDENQRNEILSQWRNSNGINGSRLAIVTGGLDFSAVSSNSKDAQLLESRLFNLQEIARFFNINPVLLGDLSHSSYSTIEAALLEFVIHTLSSYITLFEEEFSRKLLKPSEVLLYIDFDESVILKSDKSSQATYLGTLVDKGIMTKNEAREQLGLNKVDGGDELTVAYSDVSQNKVNQESNPVEDDKNIEE